MFSVMVKAHVNLSEFRITWEIGEACLPKHPNRISYGEKKQLECWHSGWARVLDVTSKEEQESQQALEFPISLLLSLL